MRRTGRHDRLPVERAKRVPILVVARRLGLGEPAMRGAEMAVLCPLHDDHNPSCYVDTDRNLWYCFVCGVGGDQIKLYQLGRGLDFREAVLELTERF